MFALVADIEKYPEFLPYCTGLCVRSRQQKAGRTIITADMSVGYKAISESFTSRVILNKVENRIDVSYIDGPFRHLTNRWRFEAMETDQCRVHFHIDYEFKSAALGLLMGAMFERAFNRFTTAFEERADAVYGIG